MLARRQIATEGSWRDIGQTGQRTLTDETVFIVIVYHVSGVRGSYRKLSRSLTAKKFKEEEIDEVDAAGLLIGSGAVFEEAADGDVDAVLTGLGGYGEPEKIGVTRRVGGWVADDMVAFQGQKQPFVEVRQVARRHPEILWEELTENHSRFLRFHHTDSPARHP